MKTIVRTSIIGTMLCLGVSACDSKEEKTRKASLEGKAESLENKADAVRVQTKTDAANVKAIGKLQADVDKEAAEAQAKADKKAADEAAKNVKKSGESAAEALENKAKETRSQK
jgi:colicin import membrane protein